MPCIKKKSKKSIWVVSSPFPKSSMQISQYNSTQYNFTNIRLDLVSRPTFAGFTGRCLVDAIWVLHQILQLLALLLDRWRHWFLFSGLCLSFWFVTELLGRVWIHPLRLLLCIFIVVSGFSRRRFIYRYRTDGKRRCLYFLVVISSSPGDELCLVFVFRWNLIFLNRI